MIDKAFRFGKIIDTVMFRAVIFAQINYLGFFHTVTKEKAKRCEHLYALLFHLVPKYRTNVQWVQRINKHHQLICLYIKDLIPK